MNKRIESVDLLRGMVMILMLLDHTRMYFHYDAFFYEPTDLKNTNLPVFLTRWITHFCAPVFIFLTGLSSFLSGLKSNRKKMSIWLIKRGIWLIVLELTIIKLAWLFQFNTTNIDLMVIWTIGVCMIFLAGIIHLPRNWILAVGLLMIFCHNLFDGYQPEGDSVFNVIWKILHVPGLIEFENINVYVSYPLIPWIGVIAVGYWFGSMFKADIKPHYRRKFMLVTGFFSVNLFVVLRISNFYGDKNLFLIGDYSLSYHIMSFLNVEKYPASLQFLLITIGFSFIALAIAEKIKNSWLNRIIIVGRVPMFFYIIHIFIVHSMAMLFALCSGYSYKEMIIEFWVTFQPGLKGYGVSLFFVYVIGLIILIIIYPLCNRYNDYKNDNRQNPFLKYL